MSRVIIPAIVMNEMLTSPPRWLKATAFAARWAVGLLLAAWFVLIAFWAVLHGWIVPRIEDYRPVLEQQGSKLLGVPLSIGSLRVVAQGLVPSFEVENLALHDPQGTVALRLPKVSVALSPRSVWNLGFEQLYIEQPTLDIRRTVDGKILVAGLALSQSNDSGHLARWFFSQTEFVIRGGQVRWTDDLRSGQALALSSVNVLVRNSLRRHAFHVDATLPADWGQTFSVNGRFRQPLLSRNTGNWRDWDGQVYTRFEAVDVSRLRQHVDLGMTVVEGNGALRAWTDFRKGQLTGATVDVALAKARLQTDAESAPLMLTDITGRLGGKRLPQGAEFSTQNLQFKMADGRAWPGGNIAVVLKNGTPKLPPSGEIHADQLDLAALGQMAHLMPMGDDAASALTSYAVKGLIEKFDAKWRGSGPWPSQFEATGRFADLSLAPGVATPGTASPGGSDTDYRAPQPGRPGVSGVSGTFELTQSGGKAHIDIRHGSVLLPGVFEDPVLPIDTLSTELSWQHQGERIAVQAQKLQFNNKDTEGTVQLNWRTSDPSKSPSHARFPGVLDLQGSLSRADALRVQRYLPLLLAPTLRSYLTSAIQQGSLSAVKFKLKGDLHNLPFSDAKQGEFHVSAQVKNAQFSYVPPTADTTTSGSAGWPALTQLGGELVFEHRSMQVRGTSGKFVGYPGLQLTRADVLISDLAQAVVQVTAEAKGPTTEALALVAHSPVNDWTNKVLGTATATGTADYKLRLTLPLSDLAKSKVQGSVVLNQNDFQLNADLPPFSKARGSVTFTESAFAVQGTAGFLGGDTRIEGGTTKRMGTLPAVLSSSGLEDPQVSFKAQGTASVVGLQQAQAWAPLSTMASYAQGSTAYSATVALRHGVPEISVQTDLSGVSIALPAPLNKAANASWPLRYDQSLLRHAPLTDRLSLEIAPLGAVVFERDLSGPRAKVLRGGIGMGLNPGEHAPMPEQGVSANMHWDKLDWDAWSVALRKPGASPAPDLGLPADVGDYLPNTLALRARELTVDGHRIKHIVAGGSRIGTTWRANVEADELSGYLEYREGSATASGRVYARLARLTMAPGTASQVEAILREPPTHIPALDIVVEDTELRGKKWGRVEIDAINRSQGDWRLNKLNVSTPEANFAASGQWMFSEAGLPRRTRMNFKLNIDDAGQLLTRFGMPDVVRKGQGKLEGDVSWQGSPLALDHPTLGGAFNIEVEKGQFLKADPGLAKLLGVLSLQSLPRRLALDFRDVFSEGFAFDVLRGDATVNKGIAYTNNLQMKGVNAAVFMEGSADIAKETQDLKVVVVPEINAGTASLVASVINPMVGLTTFLTQFVLRRPLIEANTQQFHVDGSWADPHVNRVERQPPPKEVKP